MWLLFMPWPKSLLRRGLLGSRFFQFLDLLGIGDSVLSADCNLCSLSSDSERISEESSFGDSFSGGTYWQWFKSRRDEVRNEENDVEKKYEFLLYNLRCSKFCLYTVRRRGGLGCGLT